MPVHPQANGQVEATNKTVFKILKKKLKVKKGTWVEELPEVLWAYWTTKRSPTEETPFTLACGVKVVVLVEIVSPSFRVTNYSSGLNDAEMKLCPDLIQERQDNAQITKEHTKERQPNTLTNK
jgi:hypothetical protein